MFKALFRVAIAFAVVWMLVPHGAGVEFARPGFAAVAHHFGWLHTPPDFKTADTSPSTSVPVPDCTAVVAPKRHGVKALAPVPACPDHSGRQSNK